MGYAHVFGLNPGNAEAIVREFEVEPVTKPVEQLVVQEARLTAVGKRLLELECIVTRSENVLETMFNEK